MTRSPRSYFYVVLGLACALAFTVASPSVAHSGPPVHVVFDLDDTLIRWIRPEERLAPETKVLPRDGSRINGYRYRVLDGAREMLLALAESPDVRISFFSLGEHERNVKIVAELTEGISPGKIHRILSKEDATPLDPANPEGELRKDLRKVNPDLSRVLMLDDSPKLVLESQRGRVLSPGGKPAHHFLTPVEDGKVSEPEAFFRDRNKLARSYALIELSLGRIRAGEGAVAAVRGVEAEIAAEPHALRLYRTGATAFHRVNAGYQVTPILGKGGPGCVASRLEVLFRALSTAQPR